MTAFDTDIFTDILLAKPAVLARALLIPVPEQAVAVVTVEEILRGRLDTIRRTEAGKAKCTIEEAYRVFEWTVHALSGVQLLTFTAAAEALFQQWRAARLRGSTHDLRIAATAVTQGVTLATRNRRDFEHIPGLSLEVWT